MKKFLNYFTDFHRSYFNVAMYASVLLFIAALITFNYTFDFEDSYIDKFQGKNIRILFFFLYHGLAYYGVLFIIWLFNPKQIQFTWQFWLKSLLGLAILGFDRSIFPQIWQQIMPLFPFHTRLFYFKVFFNLYGFITIVFTLFLIKMVFDRNTGEGLYGIRFRKVDWKAYWIMLLVMVPIILSATILPSILEYYPTYKRVGGIRFAQFYQVKEWVSILIYETAYLTDFLNTELFFRGFLVIGLSKLMGKNVVLPMVACYAVLHFGKPMGETISSVFGGYILGVIALYSRNIWGGVFLHGGIAMLMEIFAFWRQ